MGYQNTIVSTNLPSFPWNVGEKLDAVPLNNAFINLQQQLDNLNLRLNFLFDNLDQSNLGISMTTNWGGNSSPTQGPYVLMGSAPYEFFVLSMDASVGTTGGSFDVTFFNNGVEIIGLTQTINNFAKTNFQATGNFLVHSGDSLVMQVSNIQGFPSNSWITVNGQTVAKPEPIQGVGTGSAVGLANAFALSAIALVGQGMGTSQGASSAGAFAIAAWTGLARASGIATGDAHGVQVMLGNTTAVATGTALVSGVGSSSVQQHTFVMDDPNFGRLDINPLD